MKVYSKIVWDKDFNIVEEISSQYTGPVAQMMGFFSPPPPPPPPPPAPAPAPVAPTTYRATGRALSSGARGRGVLIQPTAPLGVVPNPEEVGASKNLLQPTQQIAQNILRLLGGGY